MRNMSSSRILGVEMKKLTDLASELQAIRILDYEADWSKMQKVFQQVKDVMTSFQVHTLIFKRAYVSAHCSFPVRNGEQHPGNGKHDTR
jgi:hypothetical protein